MQDNPQQLRQKSMADNYIRGSGKDIDVTKDWTAKELETHLQTSGLLEADEEANEEYHATTARLNQLYEQSIEATKGQTAEGINARVRHGGIKSSADFLAFINSPAGKGAKTAIALEVKKRVEIRNEIRFEQREQARRHSLIRKMLLGLFMMEYLDSKAHAAEINQQVVEERERRNEEYYDAQQEAEYNQQLSEAHQEAQQLMSHHNALQQESDDLSRKLEQTEQAISQLNEKLESLGELKEHVREELAKNDALHADTAKLLQPDSPPDLEALKAQRGHIESKMDEIKDELAQFSSTADGSEANAILNMPRDQLNERQLKQLQLSSRLQDLKESHDLLTHQTNLKTHEKTLDEMKKEFILTTDEGEEIPVLPELPPHMLAERREALCQVGEGCLFNAAENAHITEHDIHPRDLFQDWMKMPYRLYDNEGHPVAAHEKREKAAFMLPRDKNLIVHHGVQYVVPSYIKTPEDLQKLSGSELLAASHAAQENRYRPVRSYCDNCIERANREKEEALMSHEGYSKTQAAIQDEMLKSENQAREIVSEISTLKAQHDQVLEGKSPTMNFSPSRSSGRVRANFPNQSEHVKAAYLALTVSQTERIVEEYIEAVGPDQFSPREYDTLKRIMVHGNPEEKRMMLQNLERVNGSITASFSEQFASPYSTMEPAGAPQRKNAADLAFDARTKPTGEKSQPTPEHKKEEPTWTPPTPKPGGIK